MIPKSLFFIWIGARPKFTQFAVDSYKRMNPSFNVNFVHYPVQQLELLYFSRNAKTDIDQLCIDVIDNILGIRSEYSSLVTRQAIQLSKTSDIPFVQLFCDVLRLALLNKLGGLYVDCDTFPLKPFDDKLLQHSKFTVHDKMRNGVLYPNNYFLGSDGQSFWNDYFDGTSHQIVFSGNQQLVNMNRSKPADYLVRRAKFFSCRLSDRDMEPIAGSDDYFEHYSEYRWGNSKAEKSKLDNAFDKKKYLRMRT